MSETFIRDRLDRIRVACGQVLQQHGFPANDEAFEEAHWRKFKRLLQASRKPSDAGPKVKRAVAALAYVRLSRAALDGNDTAAVARYGLELGPLVANILTDALTLQVNRKKGEAKLAKANAERGDARERRKAYVRRLDAEVCAKRQKTTDESPNKDWRTRQIHQLIQRRQREGAFDDDTLGLATMKPRTIKDFLP